MNTSDKIARIRARRYLDSRRAEVSVLIGGDTGDLRSRALEVEQDAIKADVAGHSEQVLEELLLRVEKPDQLSAALTSADGHPEVALGAHLWASLVTSAPGKVRPAIRSLAAAALRADMPFHVAWSVVVALGSTQSKFATAPLVAFSRHSLAGIRQRTAVELANTMQRGPSAEGLEALLRLMEDGDDDVRSFATFALGSQLEVDSQEIRAAFRRRLSDTADETRGEAMLALARRHDQSVIPVIAQELRGETVGRLAVEAAAIAADRSLYEPLTELAAWWDVDAEFLAVALRATKPIDGV